MTEEHEVALRNVREKAKLAFLGRTRMEKLPISFWDGVAIGPNSTELSALAGHLGRDTNLLPFHFLKLPLVDIEYKDRVMMKIKIQEDLEQDAHSELADKATEEGSSMYFTGHDDIFIKVMGPDSRGRKWCFGRATFLGILSNTTSNRNNAEVTSLKGKAVDVEEELNNMQQQCFDLKSITNTLPDSLKATMDEMAMTRGYFRLFLSDEVRKFLTYVIS
ncbi:Uncharacterized protein Adt_33489 [Abeliophyllum distichum]|uniref:Uncharacterized protein n=1 Tax=Abeliophyllum distichum TaxID=126358 RepID=A0ABD1QWI6_9LAMI